MQQDAVAVKKLKGLQEVAALCHGHPDRVPFGQSFFKQSNRLPVPVPCSPLKQFFLVAHLSARAFIRTRSCLPASELRGYPIRRGEAYRATNSKMWSGSNMCLSRVPSYQRHVVQHRCPSRHFARPDPRLTDPGAAVCL